MHRSLDDSGESLEDEMAKAFESIKMSQSVDLGSSMTQSLTTNTQSILEPENGTNSTYVTPNNNGYGHSAFGTHNGTSTNDIVSNGSCYSSFSAESSTNNGINNGRPSTFTHPATLSSNNVQNGNATKKNYDCDEVRVMQKVLGNEVSSFLFVVPFSQNNLNLYFFL